jgi:hypothetical protein
MFSGSLPSILLLRRCNAFSGPQIASITRQLTISLGMPRGGSAMAHPINMEMGRASDGASGGASTGALAHGESEGILVGDAKNGEDGWLTVVW